MNWMWFFLVAFFAIPGYSQTLGNFLFFPPTVERSLKYENDFFVGQLSNSRKQNGLNLVSLFRKNKSGFDNWPGENPYLYLGIQFGRPDNEILVPSYMSLFQANTTNEAGMCTLPIVRFFGGSSLESFYEYVNSFPSAPRLKLEEARAQSTGNQALPYLLCVPRLVSGKSIESEWMAEYAAPQVVTLRIGVKIEVMRIKVWRKALALDAPLVGNGLVMDYVFGRSLGFLYSNPKEVPDDLGYPGEYYGSFGSGPSDSTIQSPLLVADAFPLVLPEGAIVEYRNTEDFPKSPGGQFFYTKDAGEQAFVDGGGAGKFKRTGRSFNIGGYVPVCRFYGSQSPGPNSHFFSAEPGECDSLKKQQVKPKPATAQQWNGEGTAFYAVLPMTDTKTLKPTCIPSTIPVYRAYNNAFTATGVKNVWDSNHRYSTSQTDIDEVVQPYGWKDEGLVYCVPG